MSDMLSVLPPDCVIRDAAVIRERYQRNVTGLERGIAAVMLPRDQEDVFRIVAAANISRVPLYPISTGKNWGLGSKLPVTDGCVVVDLSRMNRILEVDVDGPSAVIQPGVSQGQLASHLMANFPGLTLNLTGSFGGTSIVGNVIERGDGIYSRLHDLLRVEGVLGSGEAFDAGVPLCDGAGPDLTGLFCQSNFGIVTRMRVRLLAKPERRYLWWAIAADAGLERMMDSYVKLSRQRVLSPDCVNVGYSNRFLQAIAPAGPAGWNSYAVVDGAARVADAVVEELTASFAPFCSSVGAVRAGAPDPLSLLPPFLHPLVPQLNGAADYESLRMIYRLTGTPLPVEPAEMDADLTPFGMRSAVFVAQPSGARSRHVADVTDTIRIDSGLNIKVSFFGDGRTLVTIHFDLRDEEQTRRADEADCRLWDQFLAAGLLPYRVGIHRMDRLARMRPEYFSLAARLRVVFDPNGILAPGRYGPGQVP